jgi:hypothetical protein
VQSDDTVSLALEIANIGAETVTLQFSGKPVPYDFVAIAEAGGSWVWNWRATRSDTMQAIIWFRGLKPGEVLRYMGEWDLRDLRGERVPPGTYYLLGRVPGGDSVLYESSPKPLRILP